jgi:Ca-activated chloride channel family protein
MFHDPWALSLLLLVPIVLWQQWSARRKSAVRFTQTDIVADIPRTIRQRLIWVPPCLTLLALSLIVVALARPRQGRQQTIIESEGIAIQMVVDRSGSMQALDFKIDDNPVDRLTAIKHVAGGFVLGGEVAGQADTLSGRVSDLVGLIAFAGYADALTPATLDHAYLVSQLNQLEIVDARSEDGTAIGDAISLAIEKLTTLDERRAEPLKSKVVILLTDGENNAGEIDPIAAAELAKKMDIRIYTIGVGTRGQAPVPVFNPLTRRQSLQWMNVNIDEATLRKIANTTGGKYFRATDTESLQQIYAEIDQLEKTKVEAQHYVDYRELAIQPLRWGAWTWPSLTLCALLLVAARMLLNHLFFREFT